MSGPGAYDAVVIGSGFGGSVVTYRLSNAGLRVCLLERGRAYPPGTFPRNPSGAQTNFWYPPKGLYGLYNVWSFRRLAAIVSSGLGGGSLIYANVLLRMPRGWFETPDGRPWPFSYDDLKPHYRAVEDMLGATKYPPALRAQTPKTQAFLAAAGELDGFRPFLPKLAVTFAKPGREGEQIDDGSSNRFGLPRFACRMVGECDVGCNFGAKNTLDLTYLSRLGATAEVRVRSEAKTLSRKGDAYEVGYVDYGSGGREETVRARRVIVAAGSLGSTYLLLRNSKALGGLGPLLGSGFSGNGDVLTFAVKTRLNGRPRMIEPGYGPVITAAARVLDDAGRGRHLFVEDGGGPSAIWWLSQIVGAPRLALRALPTAVRVVSKTVSRRPERDIGATLSALVSDMRVAADSLPLLEMGRDLPVGRFALTSTGGLDVTWDKGDRRDYFDRAHAVSKQVAAALGGKSSDLSFRLNYFVTVHPLGGCPAGATSATGVVDSFGRIFGHEGGLYVVDGAAMPGPAGANPSLTIAAFADRAADALLAEL